MALPLNPNGRPNSDVLKPFKVNKCIRPPSTRDKPKDKKDVVVQIAAATLTLTGSRSEVDEEHHQLRNRRRRGNDRNTEHALPCRLRRAMLTVAAGASAAGRR